MLAGIRRREGLIVLSGEIGTGKTTLCRSVLQHLDRRTFAAFVADPFVSREDLLKTLLVQFGVITIGDLTRGRFTGASRSELSYPLYEFLDSLVPLQAFAVVVIDEAQNLSLPLLEEIRILSELEHREKLLQVVLVGQPELRENLKLPQMRQVDQRVSVRCELTALDANNVAAYVNHRLKVAAGGTARVEVAGPAIQAIYAGSSGVPRLINRICDRAFQRAHASQSARIDAPFVWAAIEDLGLTVSVDIQNLLPPQPLPVDTAWRPLAAPTGTPSPVPAPVPTPVPEPPPSAPLPSNSTLMDLTPENLAREDASPASSPVESVEDVSGVHRQIAHADTRKTWMVPVAAVLFVLTASLTGTVWYARVADAYESATPPAAQPPPALSQPVAVLSQPSDAAAPITAPQQVAPAPEGRYRILVAAFQNADRAQRLIDELTTAGYGAHAVKHDGGAARGPFVQVMISGYTSPIDVQRDLHRIRELPGGYTDARIEGEKGIPVEGVTSAGRAAAFDTSPAPRG